MLIEKVAGRPWATDSEERRFKSLRLTDTRNGLTSPLVPRRVRGYEPDSGRWKNAAFLAMSRPYAAGVLCSTVDDLARWNRGLHTGKWSRPHHTRR